MSPKDTLPTDEKNLGAVSVYLAKTVTTNTIKTYLAGVRNLHILHGFDLPLTDFLHLQFVLRAIKGNPRVLVCSL